jgi:hypothetical protein
MAVHGKFHATVTEGGSFTCPTGRAPVTATAVGSLTGLGSATTMERHCLDPATGQDDALITITFASGDVLREHAVAQIQPGSTPQATVVRGTWQALGGTGRFAAATGGGRIRGTVDQVSGSALVRVHGHLSALTG